MPELEVKEVAFQAKPDVVEDVYGVEIWSDGSLVIEGYRVPYLTVSVSQESGEDFIGSRTYHFILDQRLGFSIEGRDEFHQAALLVANSMAVAAGLSSFGKHCRPVGPFNNAVDDLG